MTGADSYKEFDNTSIVSSSPTQDTVKIGSVRLRKRDVLLGGIALIALLMVLILAIVLAVQVGNNDDDDDKKGAVNAAQTIKTNKSDSDQSTPATLPPDAKGLQMDLCTSPPCLKAAHYQKSNMDANFAPCEDFYSYACGSYDDNNPQNYMLTDVTPAGKIQLDNIVRLLDLISFPVDRDSLHSYERKLKHFMSSCTNHFDKMDLRGRPLIDQVLSKVGPVYFLHDDFDAANVDLHAQLKKTHVEFWTAAFFTVNVVTDQENWNKRIVEVHHDMART
ncbi:endothelin-converting enzyme 1 [Plakobranchus ocellatus]|uniref:Endothelin-converting enzyme 1 n=1 Tax=Plakobranchus ocellatus TaxID=259542 RepID=A0AAV3ZW46_9GAST|nr:endothelin-converting enzyme 1 [Plakobranchus ocellatus]